MKQFLTFKQICYHSIVYLKRNSPTVLTSIGAVGIVTTSVMTAKVTPKAIRLLEDAAFEKGETLTTVEKIKVVTPVYIPSIVMGSSTIACIFGANVLNKRKQASLVSAYALLDSYHKKYRSKLIEMHGKKADEEIRNAIAREHCDFHLIGLDVPDRKMIFYDEISGRSIVRYEREVMDAEYHLNRNFTMRGYVSLNEFYEFLGLPITDYGATVGWSMSGGYSWIDFEHRLIAEDKKGIKLYSIDIIFPPDVDYLYDFE